MKNFRQSQYFDLAYISRLSLPNPAANALQTFQMAAELNRQGVAAELFVQDMLVTEDQIRRQYAIQSIPFRICSLSMNKWPGFIRRSNSLRPFVYNSAIAASLLFSSRWRSVQEKKKVLFVRSKSEIVYWGTVRLLLPCFKNWLFVCEIHDIPALGLLAKTEQIPEINYTTIKKILKALGNYDLVIALTEALSEDIRSMSDGQVQPLVLSSSTGLERLLKPPVVTSPVERIILGYIGTVDSAHGINDLLEALRILPANFHLRITGRIPAKSQQWFKDLITDPVLAMRVEFRPHISYADIADEIDRCDIVLAPAGNTIHSERYRSPLKLFDYMARGKPVVAAGTAGNLQILKHKENAFIYRPLSPEDLAAQILSLAGDQPLAQAIAAKAWEQSARFTYDERVKRLISLVAEAFEKKKDK